jgi:hypothetical protein
LPWREPAGIRGRSLCKNLQRLPFDLKSAMQQAV